MTEPEKGKNPVFTEGRVFNLLLEIFSPRFGDLGFSVPGWKYDEPASIKDSGLKCVHAPFHPMGEFERYLALINIVLGFNHLQPLNPEP
jgi:hypothetical protein